MGKFLFLTLFIIKSLECDFMRRKAAVVEKSVDKMYINSSVNWLSINSYLSIVRDTAFANPIAKGKINHKH